MAWSIPTYDGVAAHGRPSNLRVAMFELIRAIDERVEAYAGLPSAYGWWTAASSSANQVDPSFEDLEFLKCTGTKSGGTAANTNKAYRNMELIRDRIRSQLTLGRFFTEPGGDTAYTIESMEEAIGRGLDLPESVTEASWWQAMQDALDRMIYTKKLLNPSVVDIDASYSNLTAVVGSDEEDYSGMWETVWDRRNSNSGTYSGGPYSFVYWASASINPANPYPPVLMQSFISRYALVRYETTSLSGVGDIVSSKIYYSTQWGRWFLSRPVYSSPIEVSVNGEPVSVSAVADNQLMDMTGVSLSYDFEVALSITTIEPAENPFAYELYAILSGLTGLRTGQLVVYLDMSSVLTDQQEPEEE